MLYYFSGTGNSRLVCEVLAEQLGEKYCSMLHPLSSEDEAVGIVFPVYAWGMPNVVQAFVEYILPSLLGHSNRYIYVIMTCGDDIGYTDSLVGKALKKCGRKLYAAFSVQMPNTYVCLPGFDVDSVEVADRKLNAMRVIVPEIVRQINARQATFDVVRGGFAWCKTYILRPLFNTFLTGDKRFRVTRNMCISCGLCQSHCPVENIWMSERSNFPQWKGKCTGCLGCYHICPRHAIQYGWFTKGKGQKT